VESEGRGWSSGIEGDDLDNVVRLPREWIGPLEDLVPIGPRADRVADAEGESDVASGRLELLQQGPGASGHGSPDAGAADWLTADAFWGGGSRALHQVVQETRADDKSAERAPGADGTSGLTDPRGAAGSRLLKRSRVGLGCLVGVTVLIGALAIVSTVADPSYAPSMKSQSSERRGQVLASVGGRARHASGIAGRHSSRRRTVGVHQSSPRRPASPTGLTSAHEAQAPSPSTITDASTGGAAGGTGTSAAKSTSTPTAGTTVTTGAARSVGASSGAVAASGLPAPGGPPPP
jgi:hypothetical protein